jgi:hypothetical protein
VFSGALIRVSDCKLAKSKKILFYIMFIFFTCIKKTNQKKVQPFTWSASGRLSCAAHKEWATSESRTLWVLRRFANPFFIPLLGCVKWLKLFHV